MPRRSLDSVDNSPHWAVRLAWFSGSLIILAALFAPWLVTQSPNIQNLYAPLLPPVWLDGGDRRYLLGTTVLGEDIFSQLIYGARTALLIAISASCGAMLLGGGLGLLASYRGGWIEKGVLWLVEFWMTFPAVILALLLIVTFSPGITSVVVAIILVDWTRFCRVIHVEVVALKNKEFIQIAHMMGASPSNIILHDVLPFLRPSIIMLFSSEMAISVLVESTLSFVGVSVAPAQLSWGAMIAQGLEYAYASPWLLLLPAFCIVLFILICMTLSDGMTRSRRRIKERS